MKIFVWEFEYGISGGTLVVLAESVESAREVAISTTRENAKKVNSLRDKLNRRRSALQKQGKSPFTFNDDKSYSKIVQQYYETSHLIQFPEDSVEGEPRIIELDKEAVVAFNDGGFE